MASHQMLLFVLTKAVNVVVVVVLDAYAVIPDALGCKKIPDGNAPRLCVIVVPPVVTLEKPKAIRV